jgi:hypothetical protein
MYDFGLWFCGFDGYWSATIPQETSYGIYYDGIFLGRQYHDFDLIIKIKSEDPYIIKLEDPVVLITRVGSMLNIKLGVF